MALISCPECGHKVSTAAEACPGCGFPVSKMDAVIPDQLYSLELLNCPDREGLRFASLSKELFNLGLADVNTIKKSAPAIIASNLSNEAAKNAYLKYTAIGVKTRVLQNQTVVSVVPENIKICPFCGSPNLEAYAKGFGFGKAVLGASLLGPVGAVAGLADTNKVQYKCLSCGTTGITPKTT